MRAVSWRPFLLALVAVLVATAFPGSALAQTETLSVDRVWTRDGDGNDKATFRPGEAIQYAASIRNSGAQTLTAVFHFVGYLRGHRSDGVIYDYSQHAPVNPGVAGFHSPSTVPASAPAGTYVAFVSLYDGDDTNNYASGEVEFTVATVVPPARPFLRWVRPSNGQTVAGALSESKQNCLLEASDDVARVVNYVDAHENDTQVSRPWSCEIDTTRYTNGRHTLNSVAYNAAGQEVVRASVEVSFNNPTAPAVDMPRSPSTETPEAPSTGVGGGGGPGTPVGNTYVALGDSYSSGEGLPPYVPGTERIPGADADGANDCHRSWHDAYATRLPSHVPGLGTPRFVACSGAITNDLLYEGGQQQAQLDARDALGTDTRFVTLSIGGNDVGFPEVLMACVKPRVPWPLAGDCNALLTEAEGRSEALAGTPCPDRGSCRLGSTPGDNPRPIHRLLDVIKAIQQRAPNARIYIANYPKLFGEPPKRSGGLVGTGPKKPHGACRAGLTSMPWERAEAINRGADLLNATIASEVGRALRAGLRVTHVRASAYFAGHGLCDARASWIGPVTADFARQGLAGSSFHPTKNGQCAYAAAFSDAMNGLSGAAAGASGCSAGLTRPLPSDLMLHKGTLQLDLNTSCSACSAQLVLRSRPFRRTVRLRRGKNHIVLRVGRRVRPGRHRLTVTVRSRSGRRAYRRTITVRRGRYHHE